MSKLVQLAPYALTGCHACAYLPGCGGLGRQQTMFGCLDACGACGVEQGNCDYTCPRKTRAYWEDWMEVGGLNPRVRRDVPSPTAALPLYVPMIRHGYGREDALSLDVVAINTFEVLARRTSMPSVRSPQAIRAKFRLHDSAHYLFVSVSHDQVIENLWRHKSPSMFEAFARLNPLGITAPNFSFFDDAPRPHSVRNLWRIVRCAEEMADAGIPAVLHANALHEEDWSKWAQVFRAMPTATHVCKEFQTGLQHPERALNAMNDLARLQDSIGRELHPIIVGGRRLVFEAAKRFRHFTVVDSVPFIAAMNRKRIVVFEGRVARQVDHRTQRDEPLDILLEWNISTYAGLVQAMCRDQSVEVSAEFDLDEGIDASR